MKKFISMVMAAAMVVSLVPATAFAADATATAKVVDAKTVTEAKAELAEKGYVSPAPTSAPTVGIVDAGAKPEIQIKVTSADFTAAEKTAGVATEITLTLDNAEWINGKATPVATFRNAVTITDDDSETISAPAKNDMTIKDIDDDEVTLVFKAENKAFEKDDKIAIKLDNLVVLTKTGAGTEATVEIDSDDLGLATEALTFVSVEDYGIKATLKKVADVAEEETTPLEKDLKIESTVGNFVGGQQFEIKVNSGFELKFDNNDASYTITQPDDDNKVTVTVAGTSGVDTGKDTITIKAQDIIVDAVSAKAGAVAKLTVKAVKTVGGTFKATADAVEAVKVVDNTVTLSVDEDDDVPVIYAGVDANNTGITDDSDHMSLEVTIKESAKGALDVKKALEMNLPEGVYVTDVKVTKADNAQTSAGVTLDETHFEAAYKKGECDGFEFARRALKDTDLLADPMELSFELELVAEPDFVGDVVLTLEGDAFDEAQEVVIAKFVAPWTVEAAANDLIIDYRNTKVPTDIVVKEAEEGLWEKGLEFTFGIDRFGDKDFENDAVYTVNEDDSDMEVKAAKSGLGFTVDKTSSDEAAVVTISDVALYMGRNIAAGAYDLGLLVNANINMYAEELAVPAGTTTSVTAVANEFGTAAVPTKYAVADKADFVDSHVVDKDSVDKATVKEGFINVITAGRDQDDASFTKKVVVPVGEAYIVAGEDTITLDVPAYVSAAGYTMLPVRAVAVALGINTNNVLWDQATKTVTILYGQRIITMTVGSKVINVNGSAIPASASVEVVDGRTFLPMRDLATALGVTDITWDAATKTATLNGNK